MPASPQRIEEALRAVYLKAEQDLVSAIAYKHSKGLIDYAEQAALERVQQALAAMQDACWRYVPVLVESNFYVWHPDAARLPIEGNASLTSDDNGGCVMRRRRNPKLITGACRPGYNMAYKSSRPWGWRWRYNKRDSP